MSEHLRASLPHIYAAGDAAGNLQLTPTAAYEGRLAALNALEGDVAPVDYGVVPQTIFTTPEVGRAGLTPTPRRLPAGSSATSPRTTCVAHPTDGPRGGRGLSQGRVRRAGGEGARRPDRSYAAAELTQLAALAIRTGADAQLLSSQLSIHPSHGERLIKVLGHEHHEICEPE